MLTHPAIAKDLAHARYDDMRRAAEGGRRTTRPARRRGR
jgi:hypothetical protein